MRRTGLTTALVLSIGVLSVVLTGCSSSTSSAPAAASRPAGAPAASSTAGASARASVDPGVVAAAAAYKAAADAYNRTVDKLAIGWERAIVAQPQTAKVRAHYKGMADAEQTFADAIRTVTFPKGMAGHIKALLDATDTTAALDLKASKIAIGAQVDSRDIFIAERISSGAADLVRKDFKVLGVEL